MDSNMTDSITPEALDAATQIATNQEVQRQVQTQQATANPSVDLSGAGDFIMDVSDTVGDIQAVIPDKNVADVTDTVGDIGAAADGTDFLASVGEFVSNGLSDTGEALGNFFEGAGDVLGAIGDIFDGLS